MSLATATEVFTVTTPRVLQENWMFDGVFVCLVRATHDLKPSLER